MRKSLAFFPRLFIAVALMMGASFAVAGGQPEVNWSITIGSPQPAPRIYTAPPAVYVQPQPVYIRPQPVYIRPVIAQYDMPYYVEEVRYKKDKRHHWKHRHRRDHDHDHDHH